MSTSASIGTGRTAWLLVRLRLQRLLNQMQVSAALWRRRKAGSDGQRAATPGKSRLGWLIGSFVGLSMLFGAVQISIQALSNMERVLGPAPVAASSAQTHAPSLATERARLPPAAGHGLSTGVMQAVALEAVILWLALFLFSVGSRDLGLPDWDLEWLVTLPVPLSTLLGVRVAERTLLSGGLVVLWPFLTVAAWHAGHAFFAALGLALLATLPLLAVTATLRTIIDTGLRLSISPAKLRNLQPILGIGATVLLYLAMSAGTSSAGGYVVDWAPALPAWALWLPPGLATRIVASTGPASIGQPFALLAAEAGLLAMAGLALLMWQLRAGVVAAGARESGRRPAAQRPAGALQPAPATRRLLTPIQAREIVLLARDRNFLVQSTVLPVLVIGVQFWFNTGGQFMASGWSSPTGLAAIAFFLAAYALMFSAFQTLNTEGNALWILYSVPHPLESILRQKAMLWSVVCLIYPVTIFALALAIGRPPLEMLGLAVVVFAGVPIFAVIATALGVFASDPLSQLVQRRLRPSYMYLYMMLTGLYAYTIVASTVWQRAGLMVLTGLLGLALWQKARDHLPYLLDPSASPPARVSLSDGLVAAMVFFVVQGLVGTIYALNAHKMTGSSVAIAFFIAGAVTFLLMRLAFWRLKSEGVPHFLGPGSLRAVAWGAGAGAMAALAAFIYLAIAAHTPLLETARRSALLGPNDALWLLAVTVVAAPIFEEFIFRGLIFGGLRRMLGPTASVLVSAAIFALVHPPFSVIPVFGLGVAAALVYGRTRVLAGPMAAHAVYNALVVGYQFLR